jgi:hypothetical protein
MPRQAQVILDITPNAAGWERWHAQAMREVQQLSDKIASMGGPTTGRGGRGGGVTGGGTTTATGGGAGSLGGFLVGWNKAGGLAAAYGTVLKYTVAYRMMDIPLKAISTSLNLITGELEKGGRAWMDYQEQMAFAARTMRQPGFGTGFITGAMGRDALDFLSQYRTTMEQIAKAQYELGSAGYDAAKVLTLYTIPLKLSIGLQADATQTTRTLTQMFKIFRGQVSGTVSDYELMTQISGVIAKTWDIEQFELTDLISAWKYLAGTVGVTGLSFKQVIPLMGFLSTYGNRASITGTGLNQMFTQLAKNSTVSGDQITKITKSVRGMTHEFTLQPGTHTIMDVVTQIAGALEKMGATPAERVKSLGVAMDVLNIRGGRPMLILVQHLAEYLGRVGDVANMTTQDLSDFVDKLVGIMQNTPNAQLQIMRQALDADAISFFNGAMGAGDFVEALKIVNKWLHDLIPAAETFGGTIRALFTVDLPTAWEGFKAMVQGPAGMFKMPGILQKGKERQTSWEQEMTKAQIGRTMEQEWTNLGKAGVSGTEIQKRVRTLGEGLVRDVYLKKWPGAEWEMGGRKQTIPDTAMRQWLNERVQSLSDQAVAAKGPARLTPFGPAAYKATPPGGAGKGAGGGTRPRTPEEIADELARNVMQGAEYKWQFTQLQPGLAAQAGLRFPTDWLVSVLTEIMQGRGDKRQYAKTSAGVRLQAADKLKSVLRDQMQTEMQLTDIRQGTLTTGHIHNMEQYTDAIDKSEQSLRILDGTEGLYGDSLDLINKRLTENLNLEASYRDAMKQGNLWLEDRKKRYETFQDMMDAFTAKQPLTGMQQKFAEGTIGKQFGVPANLTPEEYTAQLQEINQAVGSAKGEYDSASQAAKGYADALDYLVKVTLPELQKVAPERLAAEHAITLEQWAVKIRQTQRGWYRGGGRGAAGSQASGALDELNLEMMQLRDQYKNEPWAKGMLDSYEQTMKTETIVRPWLDARDRIQQEWADMFVQVFSGLSKGDRGAALWSGLQSIVTSMQGNMIRGWADRALGPWFDQLATQQTGIATPGDSLTGLATESTAAGGALNTLGVQTSAATAALGTFTAALTGASIGGGGVPGGSQFLPGISTQLDYRLATHVQKGVELGVSKSLAAPSPIAKGKAKGGIGRDLSTALANYSTGSMFAGALGGIMGYDAESAGTAGGLGYAAGMALGMGPLGAAALGLAAIFGFGKKKKKAPEVSPNRDIYGMPAFEWESYLYNLYKSEKNLTPYALGSVYGTGLSEGNYAAGSRALAPVAALMDNRSVGNITINVNGGDTKTVKKVIDDALKANFGPFARATVLAGV